MNLRVAGGASESRGEEECGRNTYGSRVENVMLKDGA